MTRKILSLTSLEIPQHKKLLNDIVQLSQHGQPRVATKVNSTRVLLYWSSGKRINDELLEEKRGEYGDKVIESVAQQLSFEFGKGYSRSVLFRMVRFAKLYPNLEIVATVSRQLSWSHIVILCQMEDDLHRDFNIQMSCVEKWSMRMLRQKLDCNGMA